MIDIHTHILPLVDDGSNNLETSRKLLIDAYNDGISDICLTPHFCRMDNYTLKKDAITKHFNEFKKQVSDIKVNLYLGNELMIEHNLDELLEDNELCTINNSNYVLIEFPFDDYKNDYNEYLYNIRMLGLKIIIAHPERYNFISNELIDYWLNNGYYMQANASSFKVKEKRKLLYKLIENGKLHIVASDAHSIHRPSLLSETYKLISHKFDMETADILFNTNPYNVLNNINIIKPKKIKKKLF